MLAGAALLVGRTWAQAGGGTVNDAFQTARTAVQPELQTQVVSVYGTGSPTAIDKWYIIFYDPAAPTHGRAVQVFNGKIVKTYAAHAGVTYAKDLTFDPSHVTSEGPALSAAQSYAAKRHIKYDSVHALLKQTAVNKPFRWKVELYRDGAHRGDIYVNALDDTVASYAKAAPVHTTTHASDDTGSGFAHDVQSTFLDIGGELEEFFTGERTVDR